ncbi:hypothetical protein V493_02317 [Pseudogymnoascus sp. VKM F-4281 (FW-2241)]|nr:hypothetical protein V493_02317 [Pseudogymnoascus sp. VKM F-4281 (FW-2241)]
MSSTPQCAILMTPTMQPALISGHGSSPPIVHGDGLTVAAPELVAGTAMSPVSHGSLRSVQVARSGRGKNLATPGSFGQGGDAREVRSSTTTLE